MPWAVREVGGVGSAAEVGRELRDRLLGAGNEGNLRASCGDASGERRAQAT